MRLPVWTWLLLWIALWVGGAAWLHHDVHGVVNGWHLALSFFLAINVLITFWEISLFLRIDAIEARHRERLEGRRAGARGPRRSFFLGTARFASLFSAGFWSQVWSEYARYDPSYADRRSFGFAIDVGNGFSTLLPSLVFQIGMTFAFLPAWGLGILGGLVFYQKFYGTLLYFFTYLFNRRYRGHSAAAIATFVGAINGIWLVFPAVGLFVCFRLIQGGSYDLLWR